MTLAQLQSCQILTISARDFIAIAHETAWVDQFGVGVVLEAHLRRIEIDLSISMLRYFADKRSSSDQGDKLSIAILSSDTSDLPVIDFFGKRAVDGDSSFAPLTVPFSLAHVSIELNDILKANSDGDLSLDSQSDQDSDVQSDTASVASSSAQTAYSRSSGRPDNSLLKPIADAIFNRVELLQEQSSCGTVLVLAGSTKHAKYLEEQFSTASRGQMMPIYLLTSMTDFKLIGKLQSNSSEQCIIFASEWAECLIHIPNVTLVIDTGITATLSAEGVAFDTLVPRSVAERRKQLCTAPSATYLSLYTSSAEQAELRCNVGELSTLILQLFQARQPLNYITSPPEQVRIAAEQVLIDTGCVVEGADRSSSASPSPASQCQISDFGTKCLALGAVDVKWAVVALKIIELSSNIQFAASVLAVFSHGFSMFDKLHGDGDIKHLLAAASLNKKDAESDLLYALHHFNKWIKSSVDERRQLTKDHGLKLSALDRMSQLYQKYCTTLAGLFPNLSQDLMDTDDKEVLGRAFAFAYPDKIAEFLLPSHPDAGLFFPLSGVLSRLSLNSALAIPQNVVLASTEATFLLSLHVKSHEGQSQANMCHPMRFEWLPTHVQGAIVSKLQKFSLCYSRPNVHYSCREVVVSGLKAEGKQRLITATYDPTRLLLEVYCPQAQVSEAQQIVSALVDAHLASVAESERDIPLNAERIVTLRSGFYVTNSNTGDRKVDLYAPGFINSHEEFEAWVSTAASVAPSGIASYYYGGKHHAQSSAQHAPTSSVIFNTANDAHNLRTMLIQARDSPTLDGARLAFDSRDQQHYRIDIALFNEDVPKVRLSIEDEFPGVHTELATAALNLDSNITTVWAFSSSRSQAQQIVDNFLTNRAHCTKFVNVPHRHADLYAPALTSLSTSMQSMLKSTLFEVGKGYIKITGSSVKEVSKACQSLTLALTPSYLNLTGGWRMFYTEWDKAKMQLKAPNVRLDIKMTTSRTGAFATAATLYGTQVDQAPAIIEISNWFAQFRCVEIDISLVKLQFTQTRAGGAELSKLFANSNHARGIFHRVDITSGTIFVFCPLKDLIPDTKVGAKKRYPASDRDFQRICADVTALVSRYTSIHSHGSAHATAPSKCGFCGDSDPDAESILCGHRFCTGCLVKETSNSVGPICCKHCSQVIPIKHFPQTSLLQMLSASLKLTLQSAGHSPMSESSTATLDPALSEHVLLAQQISFCPNPDCGRAGDRPADSSSYVQCEDCNANGCSLCGFRDQKLHEGCTCEQFKERLRTGDVHKHLEALFAPAEQFADAAVDVTLGRVVERIRNPLLERGCPAMIRFVRGLIAKGGINMLSGVKFAYHGTNFPAIPLICQYGFDPTRRSGQVYGPGEYFGFTASTSSGYAKPAEHSHIMILAALLNARELSINSRGVPFCYIVNNPPKWNMTYCLPLLIVRFSGSLRHSGASLSAGIGFDLTIPNTDFSFSVDLENPNSNASSSTAGPGFVTSSALITAEWQWEGDQRAIIKYSAEQTKQLETAYRLWKNNIGPSKCALTCTRLIDGISAAYEVDFGCMMQTNLKTNYRRQVKRIGGTGGLL